VFAARWRLTNVCAPLIIVFATDQAGGNRCRGADTSASLSRSFCFLLSLSILDFHEPLRYSRRKCSSRGILYGTLIELARQEVTIKSPFLYLTMCRESLRRNRERKRERERGGGGLSDISETYDDQRNYSCPINCVFYIIFFYLDYTKDQFA